MHYILYFLIFLIVSSQFIDLVTLKINHLQLQLDPTTGQEQICFDNGIGNIGDIPFIVKSNTSLSLNQGQNTVGDTSNAYQVFISFSHWKVILEPTGNIREKFIGQFILHPEHLHWHLKGVAQYNLFKSLDDGFQRTLGSLVSQSDKVSFCFFFFLLIR
jgi:hypothetical protein